MPGTTSTDLSTLLSQSMHVENTYASTDHAGVLVGHTLDSDVFLSVRLTVSLDSLHR